MLGLRLLGYLFLASSNNVDTAVGFGTTGFALVGPLELGASASGETDFPETNRVQAAGHLGLRVPVAMFELDAAATLGYADISNGKGSLLDDNPGASGSMGFVGGRGGLAWVVFCSSRRSVQASLALIASYEHDLEPYTADYTYSESSWLGSDDPTIYASAAPIGSDRTALQLAVGVGFH